MLKFPVGWKDKNSLFRRIASLYYSGPAAEEEQLIPRAQNCATCFGTGLPASREFTARFYVAFVLIAINVVAHDALRSEHHGPRRTGVLTDGTRSHSPRHFRH
jgi:hypothetical protein